MSDDPGRPPPPFEERLSFEERLRTARDKQGLTPPKAVHSSLRPDDIAGMSPWSIGMRVGVEMVSALVVAVAIGWGLDWWLGTRPIFLAVFVLLGGAAGVLNVWRMFAPKD